MFAEHDSGVDLASEAVPAQLAELSNILPSQDFIRSPPQARPSQPVDLSRTRGKGAIWDATAEYSDSQVVNPYKGFSWRPQVRSDADQHAPRCLAVLRPLRVVLVNLPEDHFQEVAARVRTNFLGQPPGNPRQSSLSELHTRHLLGFHIPVGKIRPCYSVLSK